MARLVVAGGAAHPIVIRRPQLLPLSAAAVRMYVPILVSQVRSWTWSGAKAQAHKRTSGKLRSWLWR